MTTSFHVLPPSCVTKTPFHTHSLLFAGLRSFAPTTTFCGFVGFTAIHVSALDPGVWLARASHDWPHVAFCACSIAPRPQSSDQPLMLAGSGVVLLGLEPLFETQPARTSAERMRNARTRMRAAPRLEGKSVVEAVTPDSGQRVPLSGVTILSREKMTRSYQ